MQHTGAGRVHGIWGNNVKSVEKTFQLPQKHAAVQIKARYWAIDSWDNEWAYMDVDGQEVWKQRFHWAPHHECHHGFKTFHGSFPNPWHGNHAGHRCYYDIDVKHKHSGSTLKLRFRTNINSHKNDESWAFSRVEVSTDGFGTSEHGFCLKCHDSCKSCTMLSDEDSEGRDIWSGLNAV